MEVIEKRAVVWKEVGIQIRRVFVGEGDKLIRVEPFSFLINFGELGEDPCNCVTVFDHVSGRDCTMCFSAKLGVKVRVAKRPEHGAIQFGAMRMKSKV